jgi:hypothetical protein
MKTKLLLPTLTLGLLAGVYVWQAQAQNNAPTPAKAGAQTEPLAPPAVPPEGDTARRRVVLAQPPPPYDYKLVSVLVPSFPQKGPPVGETTILEKYADWEIVSVQPSVLPDTASREPGSAVMAYTIRKLR